ncbi:MAG: tyrosine-type recombinase/integrase [Verrucomicrobiae bacterium]|nr:tyrosine-type recombinase/integrase [Verrucomicrobiae bacterium]
MASLKRKGRSPFWFCAFRLPDSRRVCRSTKQRGRTQAREVCQAWQHAADLAREHLLTQARSRALIEEIESLTGMARRKLWTVREFFADWLAVRKKDLSEGTHTRYVTAVEHFTNFLGARVEVSLEAITSDEIARLRDRLALEKSTGSANLTLKVLKAAFAEAHRRGLVSQSPAVPIKPLRASRDAVARRPFTPVELARLLDQTKGMEWHGIILLGIYTGQRLGDLATLTWANVDLLRQEIAFTAGKTKRRMVLPIARPLLAHLETLTSSDNPKAPLFPELAELARKRVGTLSNQFHKILSDVGYVDERKHVACGKGRDAKRKSSAISFHSLRHTATTLLKAAGVSDAIAREIIGHESSAVSRVYTHLSTEDLRRAVDKLPDVTTPAKE